MEHEIDWLDNPVRCDACGIESTRMLVNGEALCGRCMTPEEMNEFQLTEYDVYSVPANVDYSYE